MIPVTSARSLSEAYAILGDRPRGLRVLAGGTDLMVAINARVGLDRIGHVLDIWRVPELRGISIADGELRIGALTTYTELIRSPLIAEHLPALAAVSREVGAWAIQPADQFFVAYRKTALGADELLLRIDVPLIAGTRLSYRKVGTRKAQSVSRTIVAVRRGPGLLRIAAGCVAPVPLRCKHAEAAALAGGDVRAALEKDIAPIDDVRATAVYRSRVTGNVLLRLLA